MNLEIVFFFFLMVLGWLLHFSKKWGEAWKVGAHLSMRIYFADNLPATLTSIIGSLLLFALFAYQGELTEAPMLGAWTSASIGFLGNSAADIIGSRSKAVVPGR